MNKNFISYNWRDNCRHCPFFEDCKSTKSEEECSNFLNRQMIKSFKKCLARHEKDNNRNS